MNRAATVKACGIGLVLAALGICTPSAADHYGAQYAYARVVSSEPIVRTVTVRTPVRECREATEYYEVTRAAPGTVASTVVGAVIGGVVGHQFGSGHGNEGATFAGTLLGAAVGNTVAQARFGQVSEQYARPVRRCQTMVRETREDRIDGYRVVYQFQGQKYATRMPYDPGREIRVRVDVRPAE
jgi:uncharacterized protein YcfJ